MTNLSPLPRLGNNWARVLTGLGLVGACTVVDKGDYTFTDEPDAPGGDGGSSTTGGTAGSSGGKAGKGGTSGTSGEAGDGSGAVGGTGTGTGGAGGSSGEAGGGTGGDGGPCDPNPCEHGGHCTASGATTSCDCAGTGYQGDTCDEEIDECEPNPCMMNIPCTDLVNDFSCACPPALAGKTCDLPRFQGIPGPVMGAPAVARAVSADGTIVVGHFTGVMGFARPFFWNMLRGTIPSPIPPGIPNDVNVMPLALSGDGQRWVGEARGTATTFLLTAIGGTNASATTLDGLQMSAGASAWDLDGDGTHAVGYSTDPMSQVHAVRWDALVPVELPSPFSGAPLTTAGAITRDGAIISGAVRDSAGGYLLISWAQMGTTVPPTRRPPFALSDLAVHGLSSDGATAVGTMTDTAFANNAFVTMGSNLINIAPLVNAVRAPSHAWDVSDDGLVVVGEAELGMSGMTGGRQAVMWKNDGTYMMRTVFDVLRDNNVMPMGWRLVAAYGVSADGKVIVGEGIDPNNVTQGFIVRLP